MPGNFEPRCLKAHDLAVRRNHVSLMCAAVKPSHIAGPKNRSGMSPVSGLVAKKPAMIGPVQATRLECDCDHASD